MRSVCFLRSKHYYVIAETCEFVNRNWHSHGFFAFMGLVMVKKCTKCNKDNCGFYRDRSKKDGLKTMCKECCKKTLNKWYAKNPDKIKKYHETQYAKDKEKIKEQSKQYYENNKEKISLKNKKWRTKNKEKINAKARHRRKHDVLFGLKSSVRRRINHFLKGDKSKSSEEIIGCSYKEYKSHLEQQFTDGMTWDNYGLKGWHVDHIIPLSSAKTEDELIKLFHYTNTQPLWSDENLKKSNKIF